MIIIVLFKISLTFSYNPKNSNLEKYYNVCRKIETCSVGFLFKDRALVSTDRIEANTLKTNNRNEVALSRHIKKLLNRI